MSSMVIHQLRGNGSKSAHRRCDRTAGHLVRRRMIVVPIVAAAPKAMLLPSAPSASKPFLPHNVAATAIKQWCQVPNRIHRLQNALTDTNVRQMRDTTL